MVPRTTSLSRLFAAAVCAAGFLAPAAAQAAGDPFRSDQWGLDAVHAPEAWQQSTGTGVIVAVVDSGVQVDHPDLDGAIWTNPDETVNGVDDDANGIVDDVHGANMIDSTGDVTDNLGHGTHVAGIIAARAGNGVGGVGIAPGATIMPVKTLDGESSTQADVAHGIIYAVDEGARIVNLSSSADDISDELRAAVEYATSHGATVVTSAGNSGRDIDATPSYPASLPDPGVLSVTSLDQTGDVADNFGAKSVALAAPGDIILSTNEHGDFEMRSGSSMAAPFAAGALALLASARPDLDQAQLRDALLASSDRTARLDGKVASGALDVGAAMHRLVAGSWGVTPVRLNLRSPRKAREARRVRLRWTAADAEPVVRWKVSVDGCRTKVLTANGRSTMTRGLYRGRYNWTVSGYDADGVEIATASSRLKVTR